MLHFQLLLWKQVVTNGEYYEVNSLLTRAQILNEPVRDLPILPGPASSIEPDIMYSSISGTAAVEGNSAVVLLNQSILEVKSFKN